MTACEMAPLFLNRVHLEYNPSAGCWTWAVLCCSLCGCPHVHGGGPVESDPRRWLGHRAGHCQTRGLEGYLLVDLDPWRTLRFIRQIRGCCKRELAA
jgi:hypothetical protein